MTLTPPTLGSAGWAAVLNPALIVLDNRVIDLEVAGRPTWLTGHGAPATGTGNTGDFYLDLDTAKLYKKTDAVTWAYQLTIAGTQGPQGLPGVASAAFQPTHAYTVGTIVQHTDGTWLRCTTAHTSSSSIDLTKFTPVSTDPTTVDRSALAATYASYIGLAKVPDQIITGTITRDANEVITSAAVTWPDGTTGTFTTTTIGSQGTIDAYTITRVISGVTHTYTQSTITRDANGAATNVPAITYA